MSQVVVDADRLLSPEEASELLGVSAWTVRQWARDGGLMTRRLPGRPARWEAK